MKKTNKKEQIEECKSEGCKGTPIVKCEHGLLYCEKCLLEALRKGCSCTFSKFYSKKVH